MGMYTQLILNVELKPDTPTEVIKTLEYMLSPEYGDITPPSHMLFKTHRWESMLLSSSYYFPPATSRSFMRLDQDNQTRYLSVLCDVKYGTLEIEAFLEWIMPYTVDTEDFAGFYRYEQDEDPTLIYRRNYV